MTETTSYPHPKKLIFFSAVAVAILAGLSTMLFMKSLEKNVIRQEGQPIPTNSLPFVKKGNSDLEEKIVELEEINREMKRKITSLNTERDAAIKSASEATTTTNAPTDEEESMEELKKKAKELQRKLDAKDTQNELDKAKYTHELRTEVEKMRLELRKIKTKNLFATNLEELAPSAQDLVQQLGEYTGEKPEDLVQLYSDLKTSENSNRKLVINFESGISGISEEYQSKIQEMLVTTKPDSYFVAIGYADTVGTATKNKALSSKRATKVVESMKPLMQETQFIQAYYLGQTTRFGEPEFNRVVEIWEIQD